jgi:hypothetical protein
VKHLLYLLLFLWTTRLSAQCAADSNMINEFYFYKIETDEGEDLTVSDSIVEGMTILKNAQRFFDSLQVIPLHRALEIACRKRNMNALDAELQVHTNSKRPVWRLEGPDHYHFNRWGPGNATVWNRVMIVNARTGRIKRYKWVRTRVMADPYL